MFQQQNTIAPFPQLPSRLPMAPALYVGNLHESVDEQYLYDFFSKFGSIHFVRLMRDITTGKSRGYAFVNFLSARDAETAKQYAQYENMNGQSIRIMFRTTINQDSNIVVKNLDKSISEKQFHEFFNQSGTVLSVHIRRFRDISLGFVSYSNVQEADTALSSLNGQKLGEKNVVLERYVPKKDRAVKRSIYLKNLFFSTEEEADKWIQSTFAEFGELSSHKAFSHKPGIFSAFLCFKNDEDAEKAFKVFSKTPAVFSSGQPAYIGWHQNKTARKEQLSKSNIYIKNLKLETTQQDVTNIFSSLGTVESVALRDWESKDRKRKAKFGFILFDSDETALSVLRNLTKIPELQNLAIEGSKVEVFPYQTKKVRQQFIASTQRAKQAAEALRFQQYQYQMVANPMAPFNRYGNQFGWNPNGYNGRRGPGQFNNGMPRQQYNNGQQGGNHPQRTHTQAQRNGNPNIGWQNNRSHHYGGNQNAYNTNNRRNNVQAAPVVNPNLKPKVNPPVTVPVENKAQPKPLFTPNNLRVKMNELMSLDPERRRLLLGEILFAKVLAKTSQVQAPNITGMFLDLEVDEIIDLIESSQALDERITEAMELLADGTQ